MTPRSNDPLRAWLDQGDPAGDGREPAAAERQALRRRVLAEVPEGASGWRWAPAVALAAAAVLVIGLLMVRAWSPSGPDRMAEVAPVAAPGSDGPALGEPVAGGQPPAASAVESAAPSPPSVVAEEIAAESRAVVVDDAVTPPKLATPTTTDGADADRRQQLQFATANGTRIIWVLDADLTL